MEILSNQHISKSQMRDWTSPDRLMIMFHITFRTIRRIDFQHFLDLHWCKSNSSTQIINQLEVFSLLSKTIRCWYNPISQNTLHTCFYQNGSIGEHPPQLYSTSDSSSELNSQLSDHFCTCQLNWVFLRIFFLSSLWQPVPMLPDWMMNRRRKMEELKANPCSAVKKWKCSKIRQLNFLLPPSLHYILDYFWPIG